MTAEKPQPLSARETKKYAALKFAKYRDREGLFLSEGRKVTMDLAAHWQPECLIIDDTFNPDQLDIPTTLLSRCRTAEPQHFKRISSLGSTREMIGVFAKQTPPMPTKPLPKETVSVALDALQDPGNLGTIIRLCDWLGVRHLFLGEGTVDPYNPKVVQATAGTLANVELHEHVDLPQLLPTLFDTLIATDMQGEAPTQPGGIAHNSSRGATCLVMGNEGHGISEHLRAVCSHTLSIPPAPTSTGESLNVSISTAILLAALTENRTINH